MLTSYTMEIKDGLFRYPEGLKERFLETGDLVFRDGTRASPEQIWHFMTEEAPRRFPYAFSTSPYSIFRLPEEVELLSNLRYNYLLLSLQDRLLAAHEKGVPVVLVQGGQSMEPYYAAGAIPLRPGLVMMWAQNMEEGLNLREWDLRSMAIMEEGRRAISIEACHQVSAHAAVEKGIVPVDLIAPYLCLRCSDMAYLVEAHRHLPRRIPTYLVDYPIDRQRDQEWVVAYLADNLRGLSQKIAEVGGRRVTEEELRAEIRLANRGRRLARTYHETWCSAAAPPASSNELRWTLFYLGNDFLGDPVASQQVLEEACRELQERAEQGLKGASLRDDPVRLFICGSCITPNPSHIDSSGGAIVGYDDQWSEICVDVAEEGDSYEALARAILAFPYELPTAERARWTANQACRVRADGLIFMYHWGCNYQSAISRMLCDIVKEEAGIPTITLEVGELGRAEGLEQPQNRIEAFIEMLE